MQEAQSQIPEFTLWPIYAGAIGLIAFVMAVLLLAKRKKIAGGLTFSFALILITLSGIELVAGIIARGGEDAAELHDFILRYTHESVPAKVGHPFLIFTNNPEIANVNSLGFLDRGHFPEKPEEVIRIACLGASTSEDGYPTMLEQELRKATEKRIEVINFGNAGWTTAQSLINFALTGQHYAPDIVIVHHAANEYKVRGYPEMRMDYAHAFRPMTPPDPPRDAFLVGHSRLYSLIRFRALESRGQVYGVDAFGAIGVPNSNPQPLAPEELVPFARNLRTMRDICEARGARLILTTMPYWREDMSWGENFPDHMVETNDLIRRVSSELECPLIDIEQRLRERQDIFVDPVHMSAEGVPLKVSVILDALAPIVNSIGGEN